MNLSMVMQLWKPLSRLEMVLFWEKGPSLRCTFFPVKELQATYKSMVRPMCIRYECMTIDREKIEDGLMALFFCFWYTFEVKFNRKQKPLRVTYIFRWILTRISVPKSCKQYRYACCFLFVLSSM